MATSNYYANKRTEEDIRHNKEMERQSKAFGIAKAVTGGISDVVGSLTGVGKLATIPSQIVQNKTAAIKNMRSIPTRQDVDWYDNIPGTMENLGNVFFSIPMGGKVDLGFNQDATNHLDYHQSGILVYNFKLFPGDMEGVNIASKKLYQFVRHANSGHANYDSPDLMQILFCIDSLIVGASNIHRALTLASYFSMKNKYLGKVLLNRLGFDFEDLIENQATYRARFNTLIYQINGLFIPKLFDVTKRHLFLVNNLFLDSDEDLKLLEDVKCGLHIFRPIAGYEYDELNASCKVVAFNGKTTDTTAYSIATLESYLQKLTVMVDTLYQSESAGIMFGDLMKAFGEGSRLILPTYEAWDDVALIYDKNFVNQIHNATIITQDMGILTLGKISQDASKSQLTCNTEVNITTSAYNEVANIYRNISPASLSNVKEYARVNFLVDLDGVDPSAESIMEATRFMVYEKYIVKTAIDGGTNSYSYAVLSAGTELITKVELITYMGSNTYSIHQIPGAVYSELKSTSAKSESVPAWEILTQFGYAPIRYRVEKSTAVNSIVVIPIGEVHNITTLSRDHIALLNKVASVSEYNLQTAANSIKDQLTNSADRKTKDRKKWKTGSKEKTVDSDKK